MGHQEESQKEKEQQKASLPKIVRVEWQDPETTPAWQPQQEIDKGIPNNYTIGYLLKHTDEVVTLAGTIDPNVGTIGPNKEHRGDGSIYCDIFKFPTGCVLEIIEIDLGDEE